MNENLTNILNKVREMVSDIQNNYGETEIYSSTSGERRGRVAIYSKELTEGLRIRLVNDGSYTVGGNATREQREAYLESLREITNQTEFMSLPLNVRSMVYEVIDAVNESIERPSRDARITDRETPGREEGKNGSRQRKETPPADREGVTPPTDTRSDIQRRIDDDIELASEMHSAFSDMLDAYNNKGIKEGDSVLNNHEIFNVTFTALDEIGEEIQQMSEEIANSGKFSREYIESVEETFNDMLGRYAALSEQVKLVEIDPELKNRCDELFEKVRKRVDELKIQLAQEEQQEDRDEGGEEQPEDTRTEIEKTLDSDIDLLSDMHSAFSDILDLYKRKVTESGEVEKPELRDGIIANQATLSFVLNDINDTLELLKKHGEVVKANGKMTAQYDSVLITSLSEYLKQYEKICGQIKLEELDSKLKGECDKLIADAATYLAQVEEEYESLKQEEKGPETVKGLQVVFDAKKGRYILYDNGKEIGSSDPEETMYGDEDEVFKRVCEVTEFDEKYVKKYVDLDVYKLLEEYDRAHGTELAEEYAIAAVEENTKTMPVKLKYILSKQNDMDKDTYKDIKKRAKVAGKSGIAEVEEIKEAKTNSTVIKKADMPSKGFLESLKEFGLGALAAIINFGYSIKDVVAGKKKFKELFSLDSFRGERKVFGKTVGTKALEANTSEEQPVQRPENDMLKKIEESKDEARPFRMQITFKDGRYSYLAGENLDPAKTKFGDIEYKDIEPTRIEDEELIKKIVDTHKFTDEQTKRLDPTVYKILSAQKRFYPYLLEDYITSIKTGKPTKYTTLEYDLEILDAIPDEIVSATTKTKMKSVAEESKVMGAKVVPTVEKPSSERVEAVVETIRNDRASKSYNPNGKYRRMGSSMEKEYYEKISVYIKKIIGKDKPVTPEDRRTVNETIKRMAKERKLTLPRGINTARIPYLIATYDAEMRKKDSVYLTPEEKVEATRGGQPKGKPSEAKGKGAVEK